VNRLRDEGHRLRLEFVTDVPNKDVRFIQAQADIIVDQLRYGRYGATAREGLMLGVPVVGALNTSELVPTARSECMEEAPIVHATEETIYEVLKDLVVSPDKRRAIGAASRAYALKWWSADACAARFEDVYDRLMSGRPVWPDAPDFRQAAGLAAGF
jgi:glycosyltransferase involved in cell wall biosynthesis